MEDDSCNKSKPVYNRKDCVVKMKIRKPKKKKLFRKRKKKKQIYSQLLVFDIHMYNKFQ